MFDGGRGNEGGRRGWGRFERDNGGGRAKGGNGDGPLRLRLENWQSGGRDRKDWVPYLLGVVLYRDGGGDQTRG